MKLFKALRWALLAALMLAVPTFAQQGVLKNAAVTATGSANAVEASLIGIEGVSVTVKNAGTYQLEFEGWTGQSWEAYPGIQLSDFSRDTNTTGVGTWFFGNLGFGRIRVRASSYTSGAPNVTIVRGFGNVNAPYSAGSISGGNDAASGTGAAVPSSASYTGLNIGGNLVGQTGFTLGSSNGAAVAIIDGSGNQITSFGGGTQFAEDAVHSSGATGTMSLGVRTDSVAALAGATGDYQPFIFNSVGRLWTTATIDAALPAGTNNIGDVDVLSIAAGNNNIGDVDIASGTITTVSTVTNVATIGTSVTPGTAAGNLGKAEDAVAASGDTGVSMLAVAQATPTATAADGDYIHIKTDANGVLHANTELPTAAALADDTSNPTIPLVGAMMMAFDGTNWDRVRSSADPCAGGTKVVVTGSQTASAQLFTGTASNRTYFCSIMIRQASTSTQTFALVSGTGTVCATSLGPVSGGTSAAEGSDLPFILGAGSGTVAKTDTDADNVCILQSTTDRLSYVITYVVAP